MGKYGRDGASQALDRPAAGSHFRLWSAFSSAQFRRKLFDTMRCGSRHSSCEDRKKSPDRKKPDLRHRSRNSGSEKLSDLLKSDCGGASGNGDAETESETKRKVEVLENLQCVVKRLQVEEGEKKKEAAVDVRRLARGDREARVTLAMLGAIPSLVEMLDLGDCDLQIQALYALLNLGIGNEMNKAAIVKAGAIHKMLRLIESSDSHLSISEAIVANFLGLSALDSNKSIIGSSGAIAFLSQILQNKDPNLTKQSKQDALRAIFNLSIYSSNIPLILESNLVHFLLSSLGDMEISERILSILSNIVSTPEGRIAVGSCGDAFPILVDVLSWTDSPGCQEKASYILMVMAHKALWGRQAMLEAGIVSALLELTLLGSTLAQKRASRILECLRVDKGKQVCGVGPAISAPLCGGSMSAGGTEFASSGRSELQGVEEEMMMSEERRAVKQLVQQSLQNNMRRIVKRANLPQDFAPSDHFKSLTASCSSKSLPL